MKLRVAAILLIWIAAIVLFIIAKQIKPIID